MLITTELQLTQSEEPVVPGSTVTVAFIAPGSRGTLWKVTASKPVFAPKGLMETTRLSPAEAVLVICTRSVLFDWPSATRCVMRAFGEARDAS
jgi:hypothetical protein